MDEEATAPQPGTSATDGWAQRTEATLRLAQTASKVLLGGAVLSLAVGSLITVVAFTDFGGGGGFGQPSQWGIAVTQSLQYLLGSFLPAGVLLAAGVAVRIQALRFETEFLGN